MSDFKITELGRKTLYEGLRQKVQLKYYWNSHGKLIPWENDNGKKSESFKMTKVKIEEVQKQLYDYTFTEWQVSLNGQKVNSLGCCQYGTTSNGTLVLKMILGEG